MLKRSIIISFILFFVTVNISFSQHYYGNNQQIPLLIDSTKVTIKLESSPVPPDQNDIINSIDRIVTAYINDDVIDNFIICSLSTSDNYSSFIDSLRPINGIDFVEPYYTNIDSSAMLVGTLFYVAFDSSLSITTIDSICSVYNVTLSNEIAGLHNVYALLNTQVNNISIVDLANLFYELPQTRYAHPEFGVKPVKFSYNLYDFYHDYQPHTKKVIGEFNVATVWDFAGLTENIINVAVIDDGVTDHEDLPASRILPGYDYSSGPGPWGFGDDDASPGDTLGHGMACAGIIAASHTTDSISGLLSSSGMISINPNANIVPIKIFKDNVDVFYNTSDSDVARAIFDSYDTYNADVLSNSWGRNSTIYIDVIANAILNATINGRNGLGCPVIFASGNWFKPFGVRFPASVPSAFSVGAIDLDDIHDFSSWGPGLDIVAPSEPNGVVNGDVWSLDQMSYIGVNSKFHWINCDWDGTNCTWFEWECGENGNDVNYNCNFGGTSAAAPIVSGIASLILAKDPTLTAQQVYEILRYSAVTDLDWGSITPPNDKYGYGRADAFRAILSLARGDANNDGINGDISDFVFVVDFVFNNGDTPFPDQLLGDANCSGATDISDIVYLVDLVFTGGPPVEYPCFEY